MPAYIEFTAPGATDFIIHSTPSPLPVLDTIDNSIVLVSADGVLYSQLIGKDSGLIILNFPKESPLKGIDYDRGFDLNTLTQAADGSQCLLNWFHNIAHKSLTSFTAKIVTPFNTAGVSFTVNLITNGTLGFKPLDNGNYVGRIILRKQYA